MRCSSPVEGSPSTAWGDAQIARPDPRAVHPPHNTTVPTAILSGLKANRATNQRIRAIAKTHQCLIETNKIVGSADAEFTIYTDLDLGDELTAR